MILYQDLQYSGDANGFYNTVPTTATMLFRLGKIFLSFFSFFSFLLFFSFSLPVRTINIPCYWRDNWHISINSVSRFSHRRTVCPIGLCSKSFGSPWSPRGTKNKGWGLRAPAALWTVPRRFLLRHLHCKRQIVKSRGC